MSRPRVVQLVSTLGYGGIERWLVSLIPSLSDAGWDVVVIAKGQTPGELAKVAEAGGAAVVHAPLANGPGRFLSAVREAVSAPGPVVLNSHMHDLSALGDLALVGSHRRVPTVLSFHNTTFQSPTAPPLLRDARFRRLMMAAPLRYSLARASAVTGCSQAVLDALRLPAGKGEVVYYGVPAVVGGPSSSRVRESLGIPGGASFSLFVGRLTEQKNLPGLLAAFESVAAANAQAHLAIAGDGVLRDWLTGQAASSPVRERIHVLGARQDVRDLMRAADLLVMRSLHEGFGLVVPEAAMEGTPALVSEIPGLGEAGRLCGARLVDEADPSAFARSWSILLADPEELEARGRTAHDLAMERFTIARSAETYLDVLDAVLGHS